MPIARFEMPDGRIARFEVPEGTTPEQAQAQIEQIIAQRQAQQPATQEQPAAPEQPSSVPTGRGIGGKQAQRREEAFMTSLRQNVPLYQGDFGQLDEVGAAPELNEMSTRALKASLAANLIGSDFELAQALKAQVPEATFSRDEDANLIVTMPSGGSYYLNAPGFSGQDVIKGVTRLAAFTPAGRGLAGATLPTLARAGAQSAATEAGLQAAEAGVGGEFDTADVAIAGAGGAIGQKVGTSISTALEKRAIDSALRQGAPTSDVLKQRASAIYQQLDDSGITVQADELQNLSGKISRMVRSEGYSPRLQPKIAAVLDEIETASQGAQTIGQIDTLRKIAQSAASSMERSEARLGNMIIRQIDDFLDDLPETAIGGGQAAGESFKQARGLWSRARKSEMLAEAFERAKNQASGFENGIRVQFRSILNNPKKMRGFTHDERAAIQQVVRGGSAENMLKALGKFGFTEGQASTMLLSSLGVAGGAALGGPGGAAVVPMVGQTAKVAAQKLTARNAAMADAMVRAGRDGRKIAAAYIKNVPRSQRSVEELMGLLIEGGAENLDAVARMGRPIISDAALGASLLTFSQNLPEDEQQAEMGQMQ